MSETHLCKTLTVAFLQGLAVRLRAYSGRSGLAENLDLPSLNPV